MGNISLIPLRGNESEMRNSVAAFATDPLTVSDLGALDAPHAGRRTRAMVGVREGGCCSALLHGINPHLGAALDAAALRDALRHALVTLLPAVEHVYIYLLDGDTRLLCDDPPHELPPNGKLRDAVQKQKRLECGGLLPAELPGRHLGPLAAPLAAGTQVLIIPLVDKNSGAVVCVILVHCGQLSDSDEQNLRALERHALVAVRRLQALQKLQPWPQVSLSTSSSQTSLAKAEKAPDSSYSDLDCKILQLCGELYDLDAASLQLKVINYLKQETQSLCCCLLLVSEDNHQLFCQVVGDRVLDEEISFSLTFGRLGQVVEDKKPITLKDISEEHKQLSSMLGCEVTSMLCVPVISRATSQVVALACAFNKLSGESFTDTDEHKIQHCFCYTSTVLTSTLAFQKEQKLKCECQALLQVAKNLFTHLDDVSVLLQEIITEARNLSNAEICSVFLLDRLSHELVAKVFDGGVVDDESYEIRIPADQGIAGHVATTGKILNIKDAYSHPLFYRGVDDSTGFRTRNILCFPIKNESQGEMLSPACSMATASSPACGHESCSSTGAQSWLSSVPRTLLGIVIPCHSLYPFCQAILSMLQDMNFINTYKMDRQTLTRFCLMVKKGYRDPPYHNWMHAFSVSHFCYLLYKNLELVNYLEDIEIFALFISCMCHDLDHRGTNNSFQVASVSRAQSRDGHHFAQAIAILNSQGCNIFDHFSRKDYQRMLDLMRDIILATDLAHHLRIFKDLQKMAEVGYDSKNKQHRSLLLCLLMTSCDLSDQTKGWKTTRKIAVSDLFPKAAELYERVASNREQWTKVSHKFTIRGLPSNNSLDFLDEEYDPQVPDPQLNGCLEPEVGQPAEAGAE
uniref:Phosphodiesterase n=1 Tax=Junco hyemalis TaxID=40217 RepID=A0A8C5J2Y1_JUNHY